MKQGTVAVAYLDPGKWSASFGQSLVALYLGDAFGSQRIVPNGTELRQYCSTEGIVAGRNSVAAAFLDNTTCEWLFMVDSDMGFDPDTVDRLIKSADKYTRPIVGGLCFALDRDGSGPLHTERFRLKPTVYAYVELENEVGFTPIYDYPRDQMVRVGGTGAACVLIHRRALDKLRTLHGDTWFNKLTHPTGLRGGPRSFSEDLSFCLRATAADLPVWIDTSVKTSHHKGGIYLDEAEYDKQQLLDALKVEAFFNVWASTPWVWGSRNGA